MGTWHSYLPIRPTFASRATPYTGVFAPTVEIEGHAIWCRFALGNCAPLPLLYGCYTGYPHASRYRLATVNERPRPGVLEHPGEGNHAHRRAHFDVDDVRQQRVGATSGGAGAQPAPRNGAPKLNTPPSEATSQ